MFRKTLNYLVIAVFFCLCAVTIVIYASGYEIDLSNREISQTSTLDIQSDTAETQIYINGKLEGSDRVVKARLPHGDFRVEISKKGYHSWVKKITLGLGQAVTIHGVILFSENPKIEEFSLGDDPDKITKIADTEDLFNSDGEIFQDNSLVTRFDADVSGLCWYPGKKYIAFTQNGKLKIMENDGSNLTEILDKTSSTPVVFANSGYSVIFENNGKTLRALIR